MFLKNYAFKKCKVPLFLEQHGNPRPNAGITFLKSIRILTNQIKIEIEEKQSNEGVCMRARMCVCMYKNRSSLIFRKV